jgi:stage V sporulation protein G
MEITDVRVKLITNTSDRLKAVCTVTFDGDFVVRDVKVVEGTNGLFVAMPSRKLSVPCGRCRHKNHLRAKYCNECGAKLRVHDVPPDGDRRARFHRDIAHPITASFREIVQRQVIEAYEAERECAAEDDYTPTTYDDLEEEKDEYTALIADLKGGSRGARERDGERPPRTDSREGAGDRDADQPSEPRRGRGRRGRQRGEGQPRDDREEPAVVAPEEDASEEPTAVEPAPAPEDEPPVERPAKLAEEGPRDQVGLEEAASEPASSEDDSEDTSAFGAGL